MNESIQSLYWEAPEHTHNEKSSDWYWILGILAVAGSVTSMIFNNVLFGIVIILGAMTIFITGNRKPRTIAFEVSPRGVRVENDLYPYPTLESYFLDEENRVDPQLIVKSKKLFMSLIIIPVPVEHIDTIEKIVRAKLPEEHLEEPLSHRILELIGF